MRIYTEVTPSDLVIGEFKNSDDEIIKYNKVQFIGKVNKKIGDRFVSIDDVLTLGISEELVDDVEFNKLNKFELKCGVTSGKGFPKVKYTIVGVVKNEKLV